jgi:hypothetical protein
LANRKVVGKKRGEAAVRSVPPKLRVSGVIVDMHAKRITHPVHKRERAGSMIQEIVKVTSRPGTGHAVFFKSPSGKKIFAYSIDPTNPKRIVREDASGNRVVGRFAGDRFRADTAKS